MKNIFSLRFAQFFWPLTRLSHDGDTDCTCYLARSDKRRLPKVNRRSIGMKALTPRFIPRVECYHAVLLQAHRDLASESHPHPEHFEFCGKIGIHYELIPSATELRHQRRQIHIISKPELPTARQPLSGHQPHVVGGCLIELCKTRCIPHATMELGSYYWMHNVTQSAGNPLFPTLYSLARRPFWYCVYLSLQIGNNSP